MRPQPRTTNGKQNKEQGYLLTRERDASWLVGLPWPQVASFPSLGPGRLRDPARPILPLLIISAQSCLVPFFLSRGPAIYSPIPLNTWVGLVVVLCSCVSRPGLLSMPILPERKYCLLLCLSPRWIAPITCPSVFLLSLFCLFLDRREDQTILQHPPSLHEASCGHKSFHHPQPSASHWDKSGPGPTNRIQSILMRPILHSTNPPTFQTLSRHYRLHYQIAPICRHSQPCRPTV